MEPHEIQNQLAYFTGTEHYYKMYPNLVLTDGVKFLADACGAYWLMDVIWSHLPSVTDTFAVVRLVKAQDDSATFTLADDNPANETFATQKIEWTDFPLDQITLYAIRDENFWVILLPSEY
jgi:hypothetical protein